MAKFLFTAEPFLTGKPLEVWLDNIGIKNWCIDVNGLVDVEGDVYLEDSLGKLKRLPVKFGKVVGRFDCNDNQLVSLEGAPKEVSGDFLCMHNQLVSLEGAPKEVGRSFQCQGNQLVSLEGAPEKVGGPIWCENNQLVSLEGSPSSVLGFYCHDNQLVSLEGGPKKVGENFYCAYNQLASLEGGPKEVGGGFNCESNQLVSLRGAPKKLGNDFVCSYNQLVSLEGAPSTVGNFFCDHNLLVDFRGLERLSVGGKLVITKPDSKGQDNVIVSLGGLPKELYSKIAGLDMQAILELEKKRAMSLLGDGAAELSSEVELG